MCKYSAIYLSENASVLRRCWMGSRKSIWPIKTTSDEVLAWLSVWSEVQTTCIRSSWCHCHPIISASAKSRMVVLVLLVPSYPGCPGKKAIKRMCVCVLLIRKELLTGFNKQKKSLKLGGKLPSIEVGSTALAWPMTLTFNPLRAMVMTYSHATV